MSLSLLTARRTLLMDDIPDTVDTDDLDLDFGSKRPSRGGPIENITKKRDQ